MQWWCAAQGVAWEWTWRPYPGVWLFVGLLAGGYAWLVRRHRVGRARLASFAAGVVALWVALDWPVGALGAGYLASVHMVQFLLIALVAPPLLLHGLPPGALRSPGSGARGRWILRRVTHPLVTLLAFNAVVAATHWPSVVDGLMGSQAGSFALDMAWLAGGLLFWWPLVCPVPARPGFSHPLKVGYLILATVLATLPYAFLTFAHLPFYATYELAPPVGWMSSRTDQRVAGLLMKLGGGAVMWTAIAILFVRWYRLEEESGRSG